MESEIKIRKGLFRYHKPGEIHHDIFDGSWWIVKSCISSTPPRYQAVLEKLTDEELLIYSILLE